jgi:tetratricopeptide (TPR) repeat protein/DNA-binding MarR family transcriptional regulator
MTKRISLTVEEKILIHLIQFMKFYDQWEVPFDVTQEGIAGSIGIARCNVSRAMKKLTEKVYIEEKIAHVKGAERRRKVYFLTHQGHTGAAQIYRYLADYQVRFRSQEGSLRDLKLSQVREELDKKPRLLEIIKHISSDGIVDQHAVVSKMEHSYVDFSDKLPKLKYFFGRKSELDQLKSALETSKLIIIRGIAGIGKTTLATKLVEDQVGKSPIFWFRFHEWNTLRNLLTQFGKYLNNLGRKRLITYVNSRRRLDIADISEIIETDLKGLNAILVIDDFHKIEQKILPFFSAFSDIISRINDTVAIILTRKLIPFYNPQAVQVAKHILEIDLKGLDRESSKQLVSARQIKLDDFEKIYDFTAGHPLSLELIDPAQTTIPQALGQIDIMKYIHTEIFSKLNPDERSLLNIASVFRYPVPSELFFIDDSISYTTIDRLLAHSYLTETSNGYNAHDLVREFFYHRLNPKLKLQYHSNAAEYYVLEFERLAYIEEKERNVKANEIPSNQLDQTQSPEQDIKESKHLSLIEAQYHYLKAGMFNDALVLVLDHGVELISKGYLDEFLTILNQFNKRDIGNKDWCSILINKGDILTIKGEWDEALFYYDEALKLGKAMSEKSIQSDAHRNLARIFFQRSDWTNSLQNLEEALKISISQKNDYGIANTYFWLGSVYHRQGKYDLAIDYFNKCMDFAKKINYLPGIARTYTGLSDVYIDQGNFNKAIEFYQKSIEILHDTGHIYQMSHVYNRIGVAYCKQGDKIDKALEYYNKRIEISKSIGDIIGIGYSLSNAAECYTYKLRLDEALQCCDRAMEIFKKTDERRMIANTLMVYGMIYGRRRNWVKSKEYFESAINISKKINSPEMLAQNYFNYAFMLRDKGENAGAVDFLKEAMIIYQKLGNTIKVKTLKNELDKINI